MSKQEMAEMLDDHCMLPGLRRSLHYRQLLRLTVVELEERIERATGGDVNTPKFRQARIARRRAGRG